MEEASTGRRRKTTKRRNDDYVSTFGMFLLFHIRHVLGTCIYGKMKYVNTWASHVDHSCFVTESDEEDTMRNSGNFLYPILKCYGGRNKVFYLFVFLCVASV